MKTSALFVLALVIVVSNCPAQQGEADKARVSEQRLSAEQLAVYQGLLSSWFGKDQIKLNLAAVTDPLLRSGPFGYDKSCVRGSDFEPEQPDIVHQIREEDLTLLGPGQIRLVPPETGRRDVQQNDPGDAIRQGKPVDAAVGNGFKHGLFTLSEIRFSKDHLRAIVSFSFVCGGLCGNGSTMVMAKLKDGTWKRIRSCGGWVS